MRRRAHKLWICTLLLLGCRSEPAIDPYDSALLGLYSIESWTENHGSCDVEGPSVLESRSERRAIVQACTVPHEGLHVAPCDDERGCELEACDGNLFHVYPPGWDGLAGSDAEGWRGRSWRRPVRTGDTCRSAMRDVSVRREGETLVVRSRVIETGEYPVDEKGQCWIRDDVRAAVEGKPCETLEVLRIRRDNADCDPLDPVTCADDELCVPYGRRFVCTESVTQGQLGDPCDFESCAPGLVCVAPEWVPGCVTPACCSQYCDASAPDPASACELDGPGIVCHPFYYEGDEQPGREDVGICGLGFDCGDEVIPGEWVCDGGEDCEDGSDERDC